MPVVQSINGLASHSEGSPRITSSFSYWIDFDSLLATNTGTVMREGDIDAEAVLLNKNPG